MSVVNYFFASWDPKTGDIIPDGRGSEMFDVQVILANIVKQDTFFVDRNFGASTSELQTMLQGNVTRSVFRFGLPYPGYSGPEDRHAEQAQIFRAFVADELFPYLQHASTDDLKVYFYGDHISQYEIQSTAWSDAGKATGSFLFILMYLVVYLRSPCLALGAFFCISLSFPLAYAVYCMVYGHDQMIAINVLSLFVVMGVGADDVFVVSDVWHHSRCHGCGEMALARRFWSMCRKAGAAIFATSATTAVSFFANLASSIGPLRQFGFFMGTCITVNWVVVATVYPLMLVVHERRRYGAGQGSPGFAAMVAEGAMEMQESLVSRGGSVAVEETEKRLPTPPEKCGGLRWRLAVCLVSAAGLVIPVGALAASVKNIRPSSGVPQFFPEGSNLGDLQALQSRFGPENTVHMAAFSSRGDGADAPRISGSILSQAASPAPVPPSQGHLPRSPPATSTSPKTTQRPSHVVSSTRGHAPATQHPAHTASARPTHLRLPRQRRQHTAASSQQKISRLRWRSRATRRRRSRSSAKCCAAVLRRSSAFPQRTSTSTFTRKLRGPHPLSTGSPASLSSCCPGWRGDG
ncbi:unnamed protein product [Prorocentrum cordatum]|uniref:SSD domain-containing protein n=1 Tax=Prorocentrum cordatum TaxID=2364126 RepID=A0ABN9VJ63_9DINO|nr:unnamed protein product [Polarella glacialis]